MNPSIWNARTSRSKLLLLCLSMVLVFQTFMLSPQQSVAAVIPLPGPSTPLIYDDFSGGGVFNQNWMNWYNQDGGTGSFSKTTVDSRSVGVYAQTPVSSSSWAKFQPWNETVDVTGYRYLNFTMKNPDYPNARIRIIANDGTKNHNLTGGWVPVSDTWTTSTFDMDALSPAIDKTRIKFEIWLRQSGGSYGEILIDDITATTASSGTAPTISATNLTTNTTGVYNQNTQFVFDATYTDQDDEAPFAMQLIINDMTYDMNETDVNDTTYSDGKDYYYSTKLDHGNYSYYFRATDTTSDEVSTTVVPGLNVIYSEQIINVVVSQSGYSANDYKNAKVISTTPLVDTSYQIKDGASVVATSNLEYEGFFWEEHVYSIDFSSVTALGSDYTITTNGVSSYPFPIEENVWAGFRDEMTAFYRLQRSGVSTADAYPSGYSSVAPSAKLYHPAGHLDDGASPDGTEHYGLSGGWYDAGDYGKYGGNQWVGAEIALAYIRNKDADAVKFDIDNNGVPDLVDEAIFGSEYAVKYAEELDGAMYTLTNNVGSFKHPHKGTDNIIGTADDRIIKNYGVGGSAKAAGTLAATARAIHTAIAEGDVSPAKVTELTALANRFEAGAVIFHDYAEAHPNDPHGSYSTRDGLVNAMLLADVQLYLLTNDSVYKDAATTKINALNAGQVHSTNYWDMRPMSLAEFYPVADLSTQTHIQGLLKKQVDFFLSMADDTPYSVFNQYKNFGVNEPHASYLGDLIRYYELFEDPAALRGVLKGMYWIFGENPWNISWVSGIGTDYVDFLHTRYDEEANTSAGQGIVLPGAMVSGPNIKDTRNKWSVSPWYEDRAVKEDDTDQWRYNEYSVSIQAGLLYTIMSLSSMESVSQPAGDPPIEVPILSPVIGDYVRGNVTVFADPAANLSSLSYKPASSHMPMSASGSVFSGVVDESAATPLGNRRIDIRGVDTNGNETYSATHYTIMPPMPDPATPLLYDDFDENGFWNSRWVNWYTQNGGSASYEKVTVDGRAVGKFTQTPTSVNSTAKIQPWHNTFNVSGYRYLNFMMKNPGYEDMVIRIELSDGVKTHKLTNGFIEVPMTWENLKIDLDALSQPVKKDNVKLSIWLRQTSGDYGELLVDEIIATNDYSGTAPTLTASSISETTGDTDTDFTFNVTYTDIDNQAPYAMELVLNGVIRNMQPVNTLDTNYADGKQYQYTTKLHPGIHSYYFHTTDNSSDAISSAVQTGPIVTSTAAPSVLFSDDFNDGNASGWTASCGTWEIFDNAYRGKATSNQCLSIAGDENWTDYTLESDINIHTNSGGSRTAGLVFRYQGTGNHYLLALITDDKAGNKMELFKVENGVKTSLGYANPSILANTNYNYKVTVEGDSIEVYKDDALILSATDSTYSSGNIGVRVIGSTRAAFDNIIVTP